MFLIDISSNNGVPDWKKVKASSPIIDGVYLKVSEGIGCPDVQCKNNSAAITQLKFNYLGYYHFASLNTHDVTHDAADEAAEFCMFLNKLPKSNLPLAIDVESNPIRYVDANGKFVRPENALLADGHTPKPGIKVVPPLSPAEVQTWVTTFADTMQQKGYTDLCLYSYKPFLEANLPANHTLGTMKLWIAGYPNVFTAASKPPIPRGWSNAWLWQYTEKGRVNGINTNVDFSTNSYGQTPQHA